MKLNTKYPTTDAMKRLMVVIAVMILSGCDSLNRLYDHQHPEPSQSPRFESGEGLNSQPIRPLVVVCGGQSNMVGYWRSAAEEKYRISRTGRIMIKALNWPFIDPTIETPLDRSLSMIVFADAVAERFQRNVHLINVAIGGTSTKQWRDTYYDFLTSAIKDYNADLVLFHIGETDYDLGMTEEESYENLKAVILSVKETKNIPFYLALNSTGAALDKYSNRDEIPIRRAQMRLIREGLAQQGPDTDTLRDMYPTDEGRVHFLNEGVKAHGEAWAQAVLNTFQFLSI